MKPYKVYRSHYWDTLQTYDFETFAEAVHKAVELELAHPRQDIRLENADCADLDWEGGWWNGLTEDEQEEYEAALYAAYRARESAT